MANYDALKANVDKNGEVMIRLDTGAKLDLHKHNVEVRLNKKTGLVVMAFLFLSVRRGIKRSHIGQGHYNTGDFLRACG